MNLTKDNYLHNFTNINDIT